jgi:lysyl-tRNA synthetase class 1
MLAAHLGKPLTAVPDPFSNEHPSFGAANNARLRAFLDSFGFEYEFQSATDWYKSGRFDPMLLAMLRHYDEVQAVMLPTLGEERQQTYSIFLPISPKTGRVLQVPVVKTDVDAGTIVYRDEDGSLVETPVTGGNVKLQWKADWAGRWFALDVDYEMYGKDLISSAELSAKIVRILGGKPPEGFNYELFLDEEGKKISKSKGNGLSVEEWLRYAPPESLALYMYQAPRRAKRLFFDVIPRAIDEYLAFVEKLPKDEAAKITDNPAFHIHDGQMPANSAAGINFGMLLNLASVANTEDKDVLWQYLRRYVPGATPETAPYLDRLLSGAVAYYQDFVKSTKQFRLPTGKERAALADLAETLRGIPESESAEYIQNEVYEAGKRHFAKEELRQWFKALYEVLLGSEQGPRMGAFIKLFGRDNVVRLIERALAGEDLGKAA